MSLEGVCNKQRLLSVMFVQRRSRCIINGWLVNSTSHQLDDWRRHQSSLIVRVCACGAECRKRSWLRKRKRRTIGKCVCDEKCYCICCGKKTRGGGEKKKRRRCTGVVHLLLLLLKKKKEKELFIHSAPVATLFYSTHIIQTKVVAMALLRQPNT